MQEEIKPGTQVLGWKGPGWYSFRYYSKEDYDEPVQDMTEPVWCETIDDLAAVLLIDKETGAIHTWLGNGEEPEGLPKE